VSLERLERAVAGINPGAQRCVQWPDAPLADALRAGLDVQARRDGAALANWLRPFAQPRAVRHGSVGSFSLVLAAPVARAAFLAGMSRILERYGQGLLRMKGLLCFEGEVLPCEVHGVHGELYPVNQLDQWPDGGRESRLVCILRGPEVAEVCAALGVALGQPVP